MDNIELGPEIYVLSEPVEIISQEKALVTTHSGCIWTEVQDSDNAIGAVIVGSANYAFDAIAETEEGATGKSFKGSMPGIKLYMGGTSLLEQSKLARPEHLSMHGFTVAQEFLDVASSSLDLHNVHVGDKHSEPFFKPREGIVLWSEDGERKNVLSAKGQNQVLVIDKTVYTLTKDSFVMVDDGKITIMGPGRKRLLIDEGGIKEPEELRNLGPRIAREVAESLKNLKLSRQSKKWKSP
jgi:hypothetical protein